MKFLSALILIVGLLVATFASAKDEVRRIPVHFPKGASSVSLNGTVKGYDTADYVLQARAGQTMTVKFEPSNLSAYFNVAAAGADAALFVGSTSGNEFQGQLPADGEYTIRVYLMRSAARRKESSKFKLDIAITGEAAAAAPAGTIAAAGAAFDRNLKLQGIRFHVTSPNAAADNRVKIEPAGLEIDNSAIERAIAGKVVNAEVADLNADGSPEIYVYYATGSDAKGPSQELLAFAANRKKSLSEIVLPPLEPNDPAAKGHIGQDEFAVLEGVLGRRFPIAAGAGAESKSPITRQIQYKLVPGEATWQLKVDKVSEF